MLYQLNHDGSISVPMRAEGQSASSALGDGYITVHPGQPGYADALEKARHDMLVAQRWPRPQ
jgi:hypothetical protein